MRTTEVTHSYQFASNIHRDAFNTYLKEHQKGLTRLFNGIMAGSGRHKAKFAYEVVGRYIAYRCGIPAPLPSFLDKEEIG